MRSIIEKLRISQNNLSKMSVLEIAEILQKTAELWKNDMQLQKTALEKLSQTLSFSREMILEGLLVFPELMNKDSIIHRISIELGSDTIFENWEYDRDLGGHIKAAPLGIVAQIAAGNVFIGIIDSIISALITKNATIVRMSSHDTWFPQMFCSLLEKADHQGHVAGSVHCVHFPRDDADSLKQMLSLSDAYIVWGGSEIVETCRKIAPASVKAIEYGPKYSFMLCEKNSFRNKKTMMLAARDVIMWEQSACSSPHTIFTEDSAEEFAEVLSQCLAELSKTLPPGDRSFDENVEILRTRSAAIAEELTSKSQKLYSSSDNSWTVVADHSGNMSISPQNRTVFVTWCKSLESAAENARMLKPFIQSVGISASPDRFKALARILSDYGVVRFTNPGEMSAGLNGAPHDGGYMLRNLCNICCIETNLPETHMTISEYAGKYVPFYKNTLKIPFENSPFLTKTEIFRHGPGGDKTMLAQNSDSGWIFSSGGTTGEPKYALYSESDFDESTTLLAEIFKTAGITPDDTAANLFIAGGLWTSFIVVNEALRKIGCMILPISGNIDPDRMVEYMHTFRASAIIGLPSIIAAAAESARNSQKTLSVKKILYGGEHMRVPVRKLLTEVFAPDFIRSAGYAAVDSGPIGYQCQYTEGAVHHICSSYNYIEFIRPDGSLCNEEEEGEIVVTNLSRKHMPIIRFKTGDRGKKLSQKCRCGSSDYLFELCGRCDDVIIAGGIFIPLTDIEQFVSSISGASSCFQAILTNNSGNDLLTISIETDDTTLIQKCPETLCKDIVGCIPALFEAIDKKWLDIRIAFVLKNTIERNKRTGKIKIVEDRRK